MSDVDLLKLIKSMPVVDFKFSNRTQNVIMRNFLPDYNPTLGELAGLSYDTLLSTPQCGKQTIGEIENRLALVGLKLGSDYEEKNIRSREETRSNSPVIVPALFTKLSDINWTVRTENCLKKLYPSFKVLSGSLLSNTRPVLIGDLVAESRYTLLRIPNMGRKSIAEIDKILSENDLYLNMDVPKWNYQLVETYLEENEDNLKKNKKNNALKKFKELFPKGNSITFDDEIRALLIFTGVNSDRNSDMFLRKTGLDGKGGATLEEIGQSYKITRERVRQIVAKDKQKIKDGLLFNLNIYEKISSYIRSITFASTESIETVLKSKGYTRNHFDVRGILEFEDIIDQDSKRFSDYEIDLLPGTNISYLFRGNIRDQLKAIRSKLKKQTSAQGFIRISDLFNFCMEKEIAISQDQLMSFLKETGDVEFLSSKQDACYIKDSRNRLVNAITKCLIAHRPLKAVRVKDGLRRYKRLSQIPTTPELLEFCKSHPNLIVSNNRIDWAIHFDNSNIVSEAESQFLGAFFTPDEVLTFKELQDRLLKSGVNPVTMYLYSAQLPFIESDGRRRFALRGCPGDPFNLDRSSAGFSGSSNLQALKNILEGTTAQGHYWLSFELDDRIIKNGAFIPPQKLKQLLGEPFNIENESGEFYGKVSLINQGATGFKTAFLTNGAEAGDMIILVCDVSLKNITVALGSNEQLEALKSGDQTYSKNSSEMVEL